MKSTGLASSLFSNTLQAVLGLLFVGGNPSYHVREIERRSGAALGAIQRELARLTKAGILVKQKQGNQVYYRANSDCPIYRELRGLVLKTMGITEQLRAALESLRHKIRIAGIYGSFAKATETAASDVDLIIIGEVSLLDVVTSLSDVRAAIGREINPTVYPPAEYRLRLREGNHFLMSLMKEPVIYLIGDTYELERLGK